MEANKLTDNIIAFILDREQDEQKRKNWFHTWEVEQSLKIVTKEDQHNICVQLNKFAANRRLIEKHPKERALWRVLAHAKEPALMQFGNIDPKKEVEIYMPFGLEDFYKTFPGNVFCFAGVSNYGKTEILLMTAFMNSHRDSVFLNTDADAEEMLERIQNYQPHDAWRTKFPRKVVAAEIPELIDKFYKDQFVFVDYLKVVKEYYEISGLIEECGQAIGKGVCFVGLQKNKGVDWARGGQQTMDLSRFYVNLDPGPNDVDRASGFTYQTTELKIIKCKMLKTGYNPNGWKFIYRVIHTPGELPTFKYLYQPPEYLAYQKSKQPQQVEINIDFNEEA